MKAFGSRRDRNLLFICLALAACFLAVLAFFAASPDDDRPTSYSTQTHGAKAAYLLLARSGYGVERWTQSLDAFPSTANSHTVLILTQIRDGDTSSLKRSVRAVLDHGGRVLATGAEAAAVLPEAEAAPGGHGPEHECRAEPQGFGPLAGASDVHLTTAATWTRQGPRYQVAYTCEGLASVVSYTSGRGVVVWWASTLPLENAGISRGGNLQLLLASVGLPAGAKIVWNEAPLTEGPSLWSYAGGTPLHSIGWQLGVTALLLFFSFGRRSGPLRPDPVPSRAASTEFVQAMGALYSRAQATNAIVALAYRNFLDHLQGFLPARSTAEQGGVTALADLLERHIVRRDDPDSLRVAENLRQTLLACETESLDSALPVRRALHMVRVLHDSERYLIYRFQTPVNAPILHEE